MNVGKGDTDSIASSHYPISSPPNPPFQLSPGQIALNVAISLPARYYLLHNLSQRAPLDYSCACLHTFPRLVSHSRGRRRIPFSLMMKPNGIFFCPGEKSTPHADCTRSVHYFQIRIFFFGETEETHVANK